MTHSASLFLAFSAVKAELFQPRAVAVDLANNLYIADNLSDRVRRVDASGIITTISGNGYDGFGGDGGPAAVLHHPLGMAFDFQGSLYISDSGNSRVRIIPAQPLNFTAGPEALSFSVTVGASQAPPPQTLAISSSANLSFSTSTLTLTGGTWLQVDARNGKMPGRRPGLCRPSRPGVGVLHRT